MKLRRHKQYGALQFTPTVGITLGLGVIGIATFLWYYFINESEGIVTPEDVADAPTPEFREEGFRWDHQTNRARSVGMVPLMRVGQVMMSIPTGRAFLAMAAAAKAEAGIILTAASGFRTMNEQRVLYAKYLARLKLPPRVAYPGSSNHQGGVAVDINGTSNSAVLDWLESNAHRFGFDHKEGLAVNESWHWTYLAAVLPFVG